MITHENKQYEIIEGVINKGELYYYKDANISFFRISSETFTNKWSFKLKLL
jgi:hypothetical protein